eukprot:m.65262 g.65262  ORF g.65262 m.65262 type:complete len:723 (+) comp13534_c0_seq2:88-2256(+)
MKSRNTLKAFKRKPGKQHERSLRTHRPTRREEQRRKLCQVERMKRIRRRQCNVEPRWKGRRAQVDCVLISIQQTVLINTLQSIQQLQLSSSTHRKIFVCLASIYPTYSSSTWLIFLGPISYSSNPNSVCSVFCLNQVVDDALNGMILAYPHLNIVKGHRVIIRSDIETYKQSHVCLISGGGSGHEPAHAGFIGDGMLSAAVAGDVFASPPASAVLAAIRACAGPNGVLVIVKNYTGDRLNFGLAVEQAKFEGHKVEMIIVADDCALPRSKSKAGRRGIAGTVLVHKILGAMASSGQDLATLKTAAERLSVRLGTVGMALSSCHVPGRGPSFALRPHVFGVGIGIHGEQGANELPFVSAHDAAKCMVDLLFNQDKDYSYLPYPTQDESKYAVLINNLGGTSPLELAVATNSVIQQLTERFGATLSRVYSGTYMTSIAMTGFSISVLDVNAFEGMDVAPVLEWLDMPAKVLGWTSAIAGSIDKVSKKEPIVVKTSRPGYDQSLLSSRSRVLSKNEQETLRKAIRGACKGLLEAENELTRLDMIAGDGDCGTTMKAGASAVQRELDAGTLQVAHPAQLAQQLSALAQLSMGGTSGALYSIFFAAASSCMHDAAVNELSLRELACLGLEAGVYAMQKYGGAHEGDRTLIDVLVPLLRYMQEASAHDEFDLRRVQELVVSKAEATKTMTATCGRASYQPDIALRGNIDPGAYGVACWVSELIDAIKS